MEYVSGFEGTPQNLLALRFIAWADFNHQWCSLNCFGKQHRTNMANRFGWV